MYLTIGVKAIAGVESIQHVRNLLVSISIASVKILRQVRNHCRFLSIEITLFILINESITYFYLNLLIECKKEGELCAADRIGIIHCCEEGLICDVDRTGQEYCRIQGNL